MPNQLVVCLFDLDGSLMPQGRLLDPRIVAILRDMGKFLKLGIATGNNLEYVRGLCTGIGIPLEFLSVESGARFLHLKTDNPLSWEEVDLGIDLSHLMRFKDTIEYDLFGGTFLNERGEIVRCRPAAKESVITMFPLGDVGDSADWPGYFNALIEKHQLQLTVQRHSDGVVDILPEGVSKRLGVLQVCRILGCEPDQVLTVVDGDNDRGLASGTTSIAVANAVPEIREIVSNQGGFVSELEDGLGFAQGLRYYAQQGILPKEVGDIVLRHLTEAS